MKFSEYLYTLKVCGLRWFAWFVPLWIIIPFIRETSGDFFKDRHERKYRGVRFGNSGLFLVFSQETQNKIRDNINKNRELTKIWRRNKLKKELEELEEES